MGAIDYSLVDPETLWEDLDLAIADADLDHASDLIPHIDYMWGEPFNWCPGVVFLAWPYTSAYSKFVYLDHLQINSEIGCFVFKQHDCSRECPGQMFADFMDRPDDVKFVDPLVSCPGCDRSREGTVDALHETDEPYAFAGISEISSPKMAFGHRNSRIEVGSFNPENPPEAIQKVLQLKTYVKPIRVEYCAKSTACPGFPKKMLREARKPITKGTKTFFQMTDAANKIVNYATSSKGHKQ